jgi:hypothetical protein
MGSFFTNIQVKTTGDVSRFTNKIAESIIAIHADREMVQVDSEENADKTIVVLPGNDWVAVYDEEFEDQDLQKLERLSLALSHQLKTASISVLVHDSDWINLGLSMNGLLEETISNIDGDIDFTKNKPAAWKNVFAGNYDLNNIIQAWQKKQVIVDSFLNEFAGFIGADSSTLSTCFRYLMQEGFPGDSIQLHFVHKDRKEDAPVGPTKLILFAHPGSISAQAGEAASTIWMTMNQGAASLGLDIMMVGSSVEQGSLVPVQVLVNIINEEDGSEDEMLVPFIETVATSGEKMYYVRLEDLPIAEGFDPSLPISPKQALKFSGDSLHRIIKFEIQFEGRMAGNAELVVFFAPLANRQEGSCFAELKVEITR